MHICQFTSFTFFQFSIYSSKPRFKGFGNMENWKIEKWDAAVITSRTGKLGNWKWDAAVITSRTGKLESMFLISNTGKVGNGKTEKWDGRTFF